MTLPADCSVFLFVFVSSCTVLYKCSFIRICVWHLGVVFVVVQLNRQLDVFRNKEEEERIRREEEENDIR